MFYCSSRRRHTRCALVLEFRRVLFRSTDRPNGVESAEIIFVWNEIAMPGDNVQRRMIQRHCPEQPLKLLHDLRRFVAVLIPCLRRFEVASVGKAIGTDGTKLRQTKGLAIIFAYITAS